MNWRNHAKAPTGLKTVLVVLTSSLCVLALATVAAHAQSKSRPQRDSQKNEAQTACGVAAATDYNKANLTLMQQGTPLMSVEAMIAQRRLEEQYCLRLVRCTLDNPNSLLFEAAFDACLSDVALAPAFSNRRPRRMFVHRQHPRLLWCQFAST
jgi:hypothetical protein